MMAYTTSDRVQLYWLLRQWQRRTEQELAQPVSKLEWLRNEQNLYRLIATTRQLSFVIKELWLLEREQIIADGMTDASLRIQM